MFNPDGIIRVDDYEIPAPMRRAVLQRHRFEIFPYGARTTASLDLDHTRPYQWGEDWRPGQTDPDNLGPLRRKSHRAKTHAGWRLAQPEPGTFTWTSPLGRRYLVTTAGLTNDYRHAPGTQPWDNPLGGPLLPDPPTTRTRGNGPAPRAADPPGRRFATPDSDSGPRRRHRRPARSTTLHRTHSTGSSPEPGLGMPGSAARRPGPCRHARCRGAASQVAAQCLSVRRQM